MYAVAAYLVAILELDDEFSLNKFPITTPANGQAGRGPRALSKSVFKIGENLPPLMIITGKILKKEKN